MVIQEKDTEIRRLKALWTPNEAREAESEDSLGPLVDVPRATKLLNAPELGLGKSGARFGISAENRMSSAGAIKEVNLCFYTIAAFTFVCFTIQMFSPRII